MPRGCNGGKESLDVLCVSYLFTCTFSKKLVKTSANETSATSTPARAQLRGWAVTMRRVRTTTTPGTRNKTRPPLDGGQQALFLKASLDQPIYSVRPSVPCDFWVGASDDASFFFHLSCEQFYRIIRRRSRLRLRFIAVSQPARVARIQPTGVDLIQTLKETLSSVGIVMCGSFGDFGSPPPFKTQQ